MVRERAMPSWLDRAREIVHHDCTGQLSLEAIARAVGVHHVHLAQVFRRTFGFTVGEYVRRLRVERGAAQLLATRRTIADIALDCGFCDQSHFTRVFKVVTSSTPGEFRRSAGARVMWPPSSSAPL